MKIPAMLLRKGISAPLPPKAGGNSSSLETYDEEKYSLQLSFGATRHLLRTRNINDVIRS